MYRVRNSAIPTGMPTAIREACPAPLPCARDLHLPLHAGLEFACIQNRPSLSRGLAAAHAATRQKNAHHAPGDHEFRPPLPIHAIALRLPSYARRQADTRLAMNLRTFRKIVSAALALLAVGLGAWLGYQIAERQAIQNLSLIHI